MRKDEVPLAEIERLALSCSEAVNAREENFGWSPILFAAHMGDAGLIILLLDLQADLQAHCGQGNSALHLASRGNSLEALEVLLNQMADLESQNNHGWTALTWSAIAGCCEAAEFLLFYAAQVDARDSGGRTPCMWAARHGHQGILRLLFANSVDLLTRDEAGQTLKEHAADFDTLHKSLPEGGGQGRLGPLATDDAPYLGNSYGQPDLRRLSQQYSATARLHSRRVCTAPGTTRERQRTRREVTLTISEVVAEVFSLSQRLLMAAEENNWETALELLKAGASSTATRGQPQLRTPLMWASVHNAPAAALMLNAARAKLEARDAFGWTALHHAVHAGSSEMVSVLYYLGADFSARTDSGDTAGHLAARADAAAMLQLLRPALDTGARDSHGHTPLQTSAVNGCATALRSLLALRGDPSTKDTANRTIFSLCAAAGHCLAAQVLLEPPATPKPLWQEDHLQKVLRGLRWTGHQAPRASLGWGGFRGQRPRTDPGGSRAQRSLRRADTGRGGSKNRSILPAITEAKSEEHGEVETENETGAASRQSSVSRTSVHSQESAFSSVSEVSVESLASRTSVSSKVNPPSRKASKNRSRRSASRKVSSASTRSSMELPVTRTASTASTKSGASGEGCVRVLQNPVGLMMAASQAGESAVAEAPVTKAAALGTRDKDGRGALALACVMQKPDMVRFILGMRADMNCRDNYGDTPLMLAAAAADRATVSHLLEARAQVDILNNKGQRACDVGVHAELKRTLKLEVDRTAVERRMQRIATLQPLAKPTPEAETSRGSMRRLRLDGLPVSRPPEKLETLVRRVLEECQIDAPSHVEVIVDPFTHRPRGHAFVDFPDSARAAAAGAVFRDECNLLVTAEVA